MAKEDAPKKPMSAFFHYQAARREGIKKDRTDLNHKEIIAVSCPPLPAGYGIGMERHD